MSDEALERGDRFPAELYFPNEAGESLLQEVEVVWRQKLPPMAAAKYLLGLAFRSPTQAMRDKISRFANR